MTDRAIAQHWTRIAPMRDELTRILVDANPPMVFQPVVMLDGAEVYGYEAFVRAPAPYENPLALLAAARASGCQAELEIVCAKAAIREFGRQRLPGKLFVNFSGPALLQLDDMQGNLIDVALQAGLPPSRIVIELTERDPIQDWAPLAGVLAECRRVGFALALDDYGDGYSGLRRWLELRPEFVKIDKFFISGLHGSSPKFEALRGMVRLADALDTELIAEGVETEAELAVIRDLGVTLAQGYYLGMPAAQPDRSVLAAAGDLLRSTQIAVFPESGKMHLRQHCAGALLIGAPSVTASTPTQELIEIFTRNERLHAVAVVADGMPIGIVNRREFMDHLAQPYYREIYGRRACTTFMHTRPLVIEAALPIESLMQVLTSEDQRYLADGFVIVEQGRYLGLGTGESLVRAVAELRIEAARHANPLTFLPGNIPISEHIARLLASGTQFTACYCDLDHFKPFNDQYGYWRGDEMIKLAARVIGAHCDPLYDFVGHVGGDDFVVLFQSRDWQTRCTGIIAEFGLAARGLYDEKDVAQGGVHAEDRKGNPAFFPLTRLSIGALPVRSGHYRNAEQVASGAASAKRTAKKEADGLYIASEG